MNCRSYEKMFVWHECDFDLESMFADIGLDSNTKETISSYPSWSILAEDCLSKKSGIVQVYLYPAERASSCTTWRIIRSMIAEHLRPVMFREFVEIIRDMPGRNESMVCLGSMWGKPGYEKVLKREDQKTELVGIGYRWSKEAIFPTVHYCGNVCPMPGVVAR